MVPAALYDLMLHGWSNQKRDAQHQEHQSGAFQAPRERRQLIELILKNSMELKSEQNLRAENQKPVLIQRSFEFLF